LVDTVNVVNGVTFGRRSKDEVKMNQKLSLTKSRVRAKIMLKLLVYGISFQFGILIYLTLFLSYYFGEMPGRKFSDQKKPKTWADYARARRWSNMRAPDYFQYTDSLILKSYGDSVMCSLCLKNRGKPNSCGHYMCTSCVKMDDNFNKICFCDKPIYSKETDTTKLFTCLKHACVTEDVDDVKALLEHPSVTADQINKSTFWSSNLLSQSLLPRSLRQKYQMSQYSRSTKTVPDKQISLPILIFVCMRSGNNTDLVEAFLNSPKVDVNVVNEVENQTSPMAGLNPLIALCYKLTRESTTGMTYYFRSCITDTIRTMLQTKDQVNVDHKCKDYLRNEHNHYYYQYSDQTEEQSLCDAESILLREFSPSKEILKLIAEHRAKQTDQLNQ
ncbi:hypothetical protein YASMINEVIRUS_1148, partial [Yasminevirus sp. GU-2018]